MQAADRSKQHSAAPTFSVSSNIAADPPLIPLDVEMANANSASYFRAVVQLAIISQNILTSIYSAGTMIRSSGDIQQDITLLGQRLDQWHASLPADSRPREQARGADMKYGRERILLRFQYCSARILLTRPCLTLRQQPWKEANDASFSRRMADGCVEAAMTIVASLPDEPCPGLYEQGPWWCIVHHMMQAISVFLLALSNPSSTSQDVTTMLRCVRKTIRWLQTMRGIVAQRAHRVAVNSFQEVARRYAVDMSDLWYRVTEDRVMQQSASGM
jgi:hypothetical protein